MLAEGIAVYLDLTVLTALLRDLRASVADGSELVISVSVDRDDPELRARRAAFRERVAALGEPARTTLTVDAARDLLAGTGWQSTDRSDGVDDRVRRAGLVTAVAVAPGAGGP